MTAFRLDSVAPDLVKFGASLSFEARAALAHAAAEWACRQTDVAAALDVESIDVLFGKSSTSNLACRARITELLDDFDEKYFVESAHDRRSNFSKETMVWFGRARAMAALLYSLDAGELKYFCEALYECQAATNNLGGLKSLVMATS